MYWSHSLIRLYKLHSTTVRTYSIPIPLTRANPCSFALIFSTNMFLLVGFILTVVGGLCSINRSLTRIVGPIFLGIGVVLLISTVVYTRTRQRNNNAGQGIAEPTSEIGSTTQGGSDNVTTTTQLDPSPNGFQLQPYGQTPKYPWGTGPYPPPPAGTLCHPTGPTYPSSSRYLYNSSQNGQPANPTEITHPHRMKALLAKVALLQVPTRRRKFIKKAGLLERG